MVPFLKMQSVDVDPRDMHKKKKTESMRTPRLSYIGNSERYLPDNTSSENKDARETSTEGSGMTVGSVNYTELMHRRNTFTQRRAYMTVSLFLFSRF